jgi:hypothetical protein
VSPIVEAAAIVAAIAGIMGTIAGVWRFTVKKFTESLQTALEEVKNNTRELMPNGGTSVADAVRRLDTRTLSIETQIQYLTDGLRTHLELHNNEDRLA